MPVRAQGKRSANGLNNDDVATRPGVSGADQTSAPTTTGQTNQAADENDQAGQSRTKSWQRRDARCHRLFVMGERRNSPHRHQNSENGHNFSEAGN
jgi:hypothetical protein